nr:(2Fe-2S)-binding protein [Gammaproteobacteria bacterium]
MEGYHLPVAHKATVGAHFPTDKTQFPERSDPAFTYQYFIKSDGAPMGTAHADNKRLIGEQRNMSLMPTIFPSHMYVLAPDHLWYLSLQPDETDHVHIRFGLALAPEVLAASSDRDALVSEAVAFLDRVNEEDRVVVEGIFKGSKAPLTTPGPLSWLERENHEFTQYLARRMQDQQFV